LKTALNHFSELFAVFLNHVLIANARFKSGRGIL